MLVVTNASPLIYLAKLGRLRLLKLLFGRVAMPAAVYREVVEKGLAENLPDAAAVKTAVSEGWLAVKDTKPTLQLTATLNQIDEGEAETLNLCLQEKADLALIDDGAARRLAKTLGVSPHGTVFILLLALKRNHVNKNEAKTALAQLIEAGFRLSPELYAETLNEINEYRN